MQVFNSFSSLDCFMTSYTQIQWVTGVCVGFKFNYTLKYFLTFSVLFLMLTFYRVYFQATGNCNTIRSLCISYPLCSLTCAAPTRKMLPFSFMVYTKCILMEIPRLNSPHESFHCFSLCYWFPSSLVNSRTSPFSL